MTAASAAISTAPTPLLVSRAEAAKALGQCERTIDAMVHRGELKSLKIGRRVMFRWADLQQYVDQKLLAA